VTGYSYPLSVLQVGFQNAPIEELLREHSGCWLIWEAESSGGALALALRLSPGQRQLTLGRGEHCDLILNEGTLSQLHWVFIHVDKHWTVRDAASKNGSSLNGNPLLPGHPCPLHGGDQLVAGKALFTFLEPSGMHQRLQQNL